MWTYVDRKRANTALHSLLKVLRALGLTKFKRYGLDGARFTNTHMSWAEK